MYFLEGYSFGAGVMKTLPFVASSSAVSISWELVFRSRYADAPASMIG